MMKFHSDQSRAGLKVSIKCESLEGRQLLASGGGASSVALQQAFAQFQTDLHALSAKSQVTVSELSALSDALLKDQQDATSKPTPATVSTLQTDLLAAAKAGGTLNTTTILNDETAVLTSAGVPSADSTATTTAQLAIITSSGITGADLLTISNDEQAIQNALPTRFGGFGLGMGLGSGFDESGPPAAAGMNGSQVGSLFSLPVGFLAQLNGSHNGTSTHDGGTTTTNPVQVAATKLQADLHTLSAKSQVTVSELTALTDAVHTAQKDATSKPTAASLSALQSEITTEALAGTLNPTSIESALAVVLTTAGVPSADSSAVTRAIDAIITSSAITGTDLQTVYNDELALKVAIAASTPQHRSGRH